MKKMKPWKKMMAGLLAVVMAVSCVPSYGLEVKAAETLTEGDYSYVVNDDGESVTLVKNYTGNGGDITIPSEIAGKKVTGIGKNAFYLCDSLTGISIPSSVTSIEENAFAACDRLTSIQVDKANTKYDSRNNCNAIIETKSNTLIYGCGNTVIPSGITSIGDSAFNFSNFTSINIPSSVTSIGKYAFVSCHDLTSISIPNGVTSIEAGTFDYCFKLANVSIPSSVTNIEAYAFFDCNSLVNINIPGSVTSIGLDAFYSCDSLKSISIPSSVTRIGERAVGYEYSEEKDGPVTVPGFVIYGYSGSAAETYAKENNIKFVSTGMVGSPITCKKTVYETAYGAKPFKINATSKSKLIFTSSSPKIAAVDKNTGKITIKGTGVAAITIKSDTHTVNVMVKVSPKKASLKTVKPVKGKKLTVKWAKDKNASGYQVQVSTAKNFKKNMKQKNVTKTSYTFTKLKAGKKYYVRVRSYKKADKQTLYGAWSNKKQSGKVKK